MLPGEIVVVSKEEALALRNALTALNHCESQHEFFLKLRELGVFDFHRRISEMEREDQES